MIKDGQTTSKGFAIIDEFEFESKPQDEQSIEPELVLETKPKQAVEQPSLPSTKKAELKITIPGFPDPNKAPQYYIARGWATSFT